MLEHYGVVPLPCRPYAPDLKGKVESEIGYTQETALKGRRFETIEEQNAYLDHWDERWAMTRIHGTTKRQVRAMFEEERPFLQPLPLTRFEYYRICERTVHFDGHIEVDGAYYSAPPRYVGRRVPVHVGRLWLRILDRETHECVREHTIALYKGQRRTHDADRPKQTPIKVEQLAARIAAPAPAAEPLPRSSLRTAARSRCERSTECSICCAATKPQPSIEPAPLPCPRAFRASSSCAPISRTTPLRSSSKPSTASFRRSQPTQITSRR